MKTLVCRCEDVTLHELEAAFERGYRDIESVKRYTGFGTGWCQGKWCLALCARLVHERGGDVDKPITPRPPYHPVSLSVLAGLDDLDLPGGGPHHDEGEGAAPKAESPSHAGTLLTSSPPNRST
ncbi:(2Fe-2S)-binding protein [Polyangium jinanense]|uniref:(2Fe-2S)-binding protein n=1 Tax=Polyangium jinanense TaxID=2829994 RepID=A0A9X3X2E5_9BACT|nr:(2Fe-2S)-binding protein [Polyangium jinanense]MDC3954655.1 (2Fe-2S)-binding protein [Polyangium jinanense]MDC3980958.1 (2Fe-2S)-binding protein [Polyangium jinanense]